MATQAECVTVLQTEFERLKQYLAALPADAWTTPSACALWEVRGVVAHLTMGIEGFTLRITRGLQGETSPPEGLPSPHLWQTLAQEERRQRALRLAPGPIALRERLGKDLLSGCSHAWDSFTHLLATLSPTPFNIGIAGQAARTSPIDRCFCLWPFARVFWHDRIQSGCGSRSTHVERGEP